MNSIIGSGHLISGSYSSPSTMTDVEVDPTKTIADMTYDDIRTIYETYQRSEIAHLANHLEQTLANPKLVLSKWEIARLQSVLEKFSAKYTSPLAKALE